MINIYNSAEKMLLLIIKSNMKLKFNEITNYGYNNADN